MRDFALASLDLSRDSVIVYFEKAYETIFKDNQCEKIISTEFVDILCKEKSLKHNLVTRFMKEID